MSLHGPEEVVGDKFELCAQLYYPKDYKYFEFLACMDENYEDVPKPAKKCAKKVGMDWSKLDSCADGEWANNRVKEDYIFSATTGIQATPTMLLSGPNLPVPKALMGVPKDAEALVGAMCSALSATTVGGSTVKINTKQPLNDLLWLAAVVTLLCLAVSILTWLYIRPPSCLRSSVKMDMSQPSALSALHEEESLI